jgi:hypothetical protein
MQRLGTLARLLAVVALVAVTLELGTAGADASGLARPCRHPVFVTSKWEGQAVGRYYADSDMWNAQGYDVSQRMSVCSPGNWSVTITADNKARDGAVKTYPNVHRDYHNWNTGQEPKLSSFKSISSRFASRSPDVGIYNGAYDIWLNGVADSDSTEVMIWTDNHRQVPAGRVVKKGIEFSHRSWTLWSTSDHRYLAFVANRRIGHGSISLKKRFSYLIDHGYLRRGSTLGQVDFGYEIVSTNGTRHRFKIDRFSVTSARR